MTIQTDILGKCVLGLDPGFASLGWSLHQPFPTWTVISAGAITTKKSPRKRAILSTSDNGRRLDELREFLQEVIETYHPVLICAESASMVRNAAVNFQLGLTWGMLRSRGIPILEVSPQELKKAATGSHMATKGEIARAMQARGLIPPRLPGTASLHEHVWDSIGAVWACRHAPAFQMLRGSRSVD